MVLRDLPAGWIDAWLAEGIDLDRFQQPDVFWYDVDILRFFHRYGTGYFADLDIWDVDWERKRQLASSQGMDGLPDGPVRDPRNLEQRLYHAYLNRYISTPPWRVGKDVVRPFWRLAQRLGVQRVHLERLGILKQHAQEAGHNNKKLV